MRTGFNKEVLTNTGWQPVFTLKEGKPIFCNTRGCKIFTPFEKQQLDRSYTDYFVAGLVFGSRCVSGELVFAANQIKQLQLSEVEFKCSPCLKQQRKAITMLYTVDLKEPVVDIDVTKMSNMAMESMLAGFFESRKLIENKKTYTFVHDVKTKAIMETLAAIQGFETKNKRDLIINKSYILPTGALIR